MSPKADPVNEDAGDELPRERTHFKELLLTDHFKRAKEAKADQAPSGNTFYEELVCVGYQPQLKRLDAVVHLKNANGYSGNICSAGSQEYVKFFASTDEGATWMELGTTAFTAWDVPGTKPLEFDVTLSVDLDDKCCRDENIVLVRGILSWQVPPGDADDPVIWGNGLDAHVQVAPKALGNIFQLLQCLGFPQKVDEIAGIVDPDQIVEFGDAKAMTPLQLHRLYQETDVPQHRYLLGHVAQVLADPVALSTIAKQPALGLFPGMKDLVDIGSIIKFLQDPQGNQTYEQLGCVGLNTTSNELVATVDVKLSSGYSGNLCTKGSHENVAFWVDWGSGWEYAGTTSVNVHDIASIPDDGLQFSAALPFPQLLAHRQPCKAGATTARVRAVLSWSTLPSDTDPYAVPFWGGHLETNVLIPPGDAILGGGPVLEAIGSMPLLYIDPVTGLADGQSTVGFVASGSPFGRQVNFAGWVINPATGLPGGGGMQYRILLSKDAGATFTPMKDTFGVVTVNLPSGVQNTVLQTPDASGWCPYLADFTTPGSIVSVVQNILGYETTAGDGKLWISMEARQGASPLGATPWKVIQLDNTAPDAAVAITSGGGSCGDFKPGDLIQGTYSASDNEALSGVSVTVLMAMPGAAVTKLPSTVTLTVEAGTWELQTLPETTPCGYVIRVVAADRTIVDSSGIHWTGDDNTGFCLRP